jgi:colanic acid/amylovoran biosynthesis glycosyltransferase
MKYRAYNKKIGIVLSSTPGYSETFFKSKIKGLQESGYDVTLFVDTIN